MTLRAVAALVVGCLAGVAVQWGSLHPKVALLIVMALLSIVPYVVRAMQRRFHVFEPITILTLCVIVLFVVRPAAELIAGPGGYVDLGFTPEGGFVGAMVISIAGTAALYLGYFMASGTNIARRLPTLPATWDTRRSVVFVVGLLTVAGLMTLVFAATLGGLGALYRFYLGRTATDYQAALQTAAYFALAPYMAIPAMLIIYTAFLRQRTITRGMLLALTFGIVVFTTVPRGDRTYVLAAFMPLVMMRYLRQDRVPSTAGIVGAIVVSIIAINVLISLRHVETRAQRGVESTIVDSITSPVSELTDFVVGVDLAEFTVMEIEYMAIKSKSLELHPGSTALSVIAGPLPGRILKDKKPKPATLYIANWMFPNRGRPTTFLPSVYGDHYGDYGLVTVILYSLLIGIGCRALWEYYRRNRHSEGMQIIFAASLPLMIALMRNNLSDVGGRAVFLVFPLIACLILCGRGVRATGTRRAA